MTQPTIIDEMLARINEQRKPTAQSAAYEQKKLMRGFVAAAITEHFGEIKPKQYKVPDSIQAAFDALLDESPKLSDNEPPS